MVILNWYTGKVESVEVTKAQGYKVERFKDEEFESNSYLGSGQALAYQDLEIRGGGNIIGEAQSGHIKQIGYSLYLKMLEDALATLSGETEEQKIQVDVKLAISAYISSELISEDRVRLELYRRLSQCEDIKES